jgi:hypothetical protein
VDWNGDNKKDLLTGEYNGNVRIYLNTGTDANPVFSGYSLLLVGGSTFDAGDYSAICLADWDNNGLIDLIVGDSSGKVWLLINSGTAGNPVFNSAVRVKNGGADLNAGGVSCPAVGDWNRDGKKDLVCGETYGTMVYYENLGTDDTPVFNGSEKLNVGHAYPGAYTIDVGYYSRPNLVDWDGDNVLDILTGTSNGNVELYCGVGPLFLSQNFIPDSTGAVVSLELNAGAANAGRTYLVLASVSGTDPGFDLPGGLVLPINWDPFTDLVITLLNSPVFYDFMGNLNAKGVGSARLSAPASTGYLGTTIHMAYCLGMPFDYVSNATAVEIVP